MKNILIFIAVFSMTLVSCNKDYACACTVTSGGQTIDHTYRLKAMKKKEAIKTCNSAGATWTDIGGSCTLNKEGN